MSAWEIETGTDSEGDPFVRIISDDEAVLEDSRAMAAVSRAAKREFGRHAKVMTRGSSYFDSRGREAGWQWSVEIGGDQ